MKYNFSRYFIIHNNKIVLTTNPNFGEKLKDCYYIKKLGSPIHPRILLDIKKDNKIVTKNELIGNYQSLMEFIADKPTAFICIGGFSRAGMGEFLRMLKNQKNIDIKHVKFKNKISQVQYERHLETKQERIKELNEKLENIEELENATQYMKVCNYVFGKDRCESRRRVLSLQKSKKI